MKSSEAFLFLNRNTKNVWNIYFFSWNKTFFFFFFKVNEKNNNQPITEDQLCQDLQNQPLTSPGYCYEIEPKTQSKRTTTDELFLFGVVNILQKSAKGLNFVLLENDKRNATC